MKVGVTDEKGTPRWTSARLVEVARHGPRVTLIFTLDYPGGALTIEVSPAEAAKIKSALRRRGN